MAKMSDKNRLGTGLAVAVGVHILLAVVMGYFGYHFIDKPPQILEVTLAGGGAAAGGEQVEQQQENSIVRSLDDIIDKKLKPETKKQVVPIKAKPSTDNKAANTANLSAANVGEGNGSGEETGNAESGGNGSGSGSGNGSGDSDGRAKVSVPPRPSSTPAPIYPSSAKNSGAQGVTQVRMLINANGRVDEAAITGSSGNSAIDEAVLKAIYKWRFVPAKNGYGENVACYVNQAIRFNLRK